METRTLTTSSQFLGRVSPNVQVTADAGRTDRSVPGARFGKHQIRSRRPCGKFLGLRSRDDLWMLNLASLRCCVNFQRADHAALLVAGNIAVDGVVARLQVAHCETSGVAR